MPTKGTLPTAREMEGQVLAALQELGGEAYFTRIDQQIKGNLEPLVYISQFKKETQDFYETSFSSKCARARRSLRKQGLIESGTQRGHWRLNVGSQIEPSKVRKQGTSRVSNFVAEAIEKLEEIGASPDAIDTIRELWLEFQTTAEVSRDTEANKEVEKKALDFIRKRERNKRWHRPTNSNNKGFDLYQTDSGKRSGNITVWCEVKSLSGKFSSVSLTAAEFEEAQKRGDSYWLYIVEGVDKLDKGGEPSLLRIQNPAGKAERFSYRHRPWRSAAEP